MGEKHETGTLLAVTNKVMVTLSFYGILYWDQIVFKQIRNCISSSIQVFFAVEAVKRHIALVIEFQVKQNLIPKQRIENASDFTGASHKYLLRVAVGIKNENIFLGNSCEPPVYFLGNSAKRTKEARG